MKLIKTKHYTKRSQERAIAIKDEVILTALRGLEKGEYIIRALGGIYIPITKEIKGIVILKTIIQNKEKNVARLARRNKATLVDVWV